MNGKLKGIICGVVAAISYGTNPLGALFLYKEGVNASSVLFYRFSLAAIILGILMLVQKTSFKVTKKELGVLACLGLVFGISSLSLFTSFNYLDAGIASSLLFVYPVMVAVIMAIFFKEKISFATVVSICLALGGIALLYKNETGATLSTLGVVLVMISSLSYALYIIIVNKSTMLMSSVKLTFYVLLFCVSTIIIRSFFGEGNHIQLLTTPAMWGWALMLALIPTIVSLILMVIAVHHIGSTPTAIMGALEPLTAVMIGVLVFGEVLTTRVAIGILMILLGVIIIIASKSFKPQMITKKIDDVKRIFLKHFRWKS